MFLHTIVLWTKVLTSWNAAHLSSNHNGPGGPLLVWLLLDAFWGEKKKKKVDLNFEFTSDL